MLLNTVPDRGLAFHLLKATLTDHVLEITLVDPYFQVQLPRRDGSYSRWLPGGAEAGRACANTGRQEV